MRRTVKFSIFLSLFLFAMVSAVMAEGQIAHNKLAGKKILYIERNQYMRDHHNTATLFEWGEVNSEKFDPGSAMRIYDVDTKQITTLVESQTGVVRDPELSYDATKVVFSMRNNIEDGYHIYEINIDGTGLKQLTFAEGVSDIDPLYLPDGGILFSSTREPKYCMCNRHIMANLFRMNDDGSNITQLGVSTLFEGHATVLNDGRILYDRWEYVDRNFGDAQGLWTVNPDGTKHAIYYGNNTPSPGGVVDARPIPGSDKVACIFSSCHDLSWGALAIIDRKLGVDGPEAVVNIWPANGRNLMTNPKSNWDAFRPITKKYDSPFPLSESEILVSRTIDTVGLKTDIKTAHKEMLGIYYVTTDGVEDMLLKSDVEAKSLFDPMFVEPRVVPNAIPFMRDFESKTGTFYVQNVYEGTHMEGVEKGAAKWLRIIETPPKRTWVNQKWGGQGAQFPGINWHSFEVKNVYGVVPIEEDGSANFEAPAGKFLYFQILDKDMKMIQSMRSGVSLMPGEVNGCIGCHEDRINIPPAMPTLPMALKKPAVEVTEWVKEGHKNFSYVENVQPILDRSCVKCHDFDPEKPEKLVLAGDKNPYFNASYINLYVKGKVKLVGGGPAATQQAYAWGSHKSIITQIIENTHASHKKVKLTDEELETMYEWMDINGVYYPTYETSFGDNPAGRSPLTVSQTKELIELTGININLYSNSKRKVTALVSFDRPELSPILDSIRTDKAKYDRAIEILQMGQKALLELPRGDIEDQLVVCEQQRKQLENYAARLLEENGCIIDTETKRYDK
ncbi:MAG: hypothetical protein SNG02_00525 [Rikenellaceae bacterium]